MERRESFQERRKRQQARRRLLGKLAAVLIGAVFLFGLCKKTADQFLLYDASADQPEYAVRLYYPDRDGLLTAREAVVRTADPEQLPLLALQALVSREVPVNLTRAIPYRTQVLDLSVTNGSASVVLSDDFMSCDVSAQQAANAVRAIAATLCALDSITAVQLSVIGETGLTYYDISQPITPQADWYAE